VRPTWAEIDLAAIAHNVEVLRALVAPAGLCAVVKADGYGHGAVPVARAAVGAGADRLAVALVEEAAVLRAAGIEAPIVVLSEPPASSAADAVALRVEPAVYSQGGVTALADAAAAAGGPPLAVHLKIDTGMHRVGALPDEVPALAQAVAARPELVLASVWTHCAVADEPGNRFTTEQFARYDEAVRGLEGDGIGVPVRHAGNSAVAIAHPAGRYDLVRCGIAVYGIDPSADLAGLVDLRPALRLVSQVSFVKQVEAGEAISYGQHHRLEQRSTIATVPVGYADGVRRSLGATGGEVLIGGRRRRIAGTVTMDMTTIDCGADDTVEVGDEVVLLGRQGSAEINAMEWAQRTGTIAYEIVCGISGRVPRRYIGGPGSPEGPGSPDREDD